MLTVNNLSFCWAETEISLVSTLRSHLARVTCPTVSQIRFKQSCNEDLWRFSRAPRYTDTTTHWGITVNLGSWFLSLLLWQIDSPISKVSHGALLTKNWYFGGIFFTYFGSLLTILQHLEWGVVLISLHILKHDLG